MKSQNRLVDSGILAQVHILTAEFHSARIPVWWLWLPLLGCNYLQRLYGVPARH